MNKILIIAVAACALVLPGCSLPTDYQMEQGALDFYPEAVRAQSTGNRGVLLTMEDGSSIWVRLDYSVKVGGDPAFEIEKEVKAK